MMYRFTLYIVVFLIAPFTGAQVFIGNGGSIATTNNSIVFLNNTNLVNNGYVKHAGLLVIEGSLTNNDSFVSSDNGTNQVLLDQSWINNGNYTSGNGRVIFNGTNQIIGGTEPSSFYDLILQGDVGDIKTAQASLTVKDSLKLSNVELAVQNNVLTLARASIEVTREVGYISTEFPGIVSVNMDIFSRGNIELPLGFSIDPDDYRPFILKDPSQEVYEFGLYGNNPSVDGFDESSLNDSICSIQNAYYYYLKTASSSLNYSLKLTSDESNYTKMAIWRNAEWQKLTNSNDFSISEMVGTQTENQGNYMTLGVEQPFAYAGEDAIDRDGGIYQLQGDGYLTRLTSMNWTPSIDLSCFDCFEPIFTFGEAGEFVLTVDNGIGCLHSDTVEIIHLREKVFTENAFTPNRDNLNEVFSPKLLSNETLVKIEVYNRWGAKVYDGNKGWDGTSHSGVPAPQGVYIYVLTVDQALLKGTKKVYFSKGTLTLLR
jgi:gliding motility-associated-like protein